MIHLTWAQAPSSDKGGRLLAEILPWLLVLVGVVIVGGIVIYLVRRWMRAETPSASDFTLQDLRNLHAAGELTDEQFERSKAMMIGRLSASAKASEQAPSPGNHEQSSR